MLLIGMDEELGSVFIEFETGIAGYARELDEDRIIDYSSNPGRPIGVSLHNIGNGVILEGLPQTEKVRNILTGLGVAVK